METILHLLPLTGAQKAAFRPPRRSLSISFSPPMTAGSQQHPPGVAGAHHHSAWLCPPDQLQDLPNLKWVQSWNAGWTPTWPPGVLPGGVRLTSAVGAYGPAVSEHMLAMLLAIYKRLPAYRDQQRAHIWADLGPVGSPGGQNRAGGRCRRYRPPLCPAGPRPGGTAGYWAAPERGLPGRGL